MNEATGPVEDTETKESVWDPLTDRQQSYVDLNLPPRPNQKIDTVEIQGVVVGRDRTVVPPHDVYRLATIGCKDREIAEWFGIDSNTLRYNFSVELIKGRETLKQSLRRKQIEVAMTGNPTMLIFLGKNLLGQADSPQSEGMNQPLPWQDS